MIFSDSLTLLDYVSKASVVVILILIIYGGYRRWWVFGWHYKELQDRFRKMENEKNAWRRTALHGAKIATDAFDALRGMEDAP